VSETAGEVEVLSGAAAGGLRWEVVCPGDDEDLYTMLRVYSGGKRAVAGSGFGGPKLLPPRPFPAPRRGPHT
jgi:hypothetical protein